MTDSPLLERKRKPCNEVEVEADCPINAAKAVKSLEEAATSEAERDDTIDPKLVDTQRIIEHAINLSKEELDVVHQRYYPGQKTGVTPSLRDAYNVVDSSKTSLQTLAGRVVSKEKGAAVYKMPAEILYHVFNYLDTEALFTCLAVCRIWRFALDDPTARALVWSKALSIIRTDIAHLDKEWKRLCSRSNVKRLSLTLLEEFRMKFEDRSSLLQQLRQTDLARSFPIWISEFMLDTNVWCIEDVLLRSLAKCDRLKVLHWKIGGMSSMYPLEYMSEKDAPLANCTLEEFHFNVTATIMIDVAFIQMLRQVKRLHIVGGLNRSHIAAILDLAQDSLEELIVVKIFEGGGWIGQAPEEVKRGYVMKKLRKVHLQECCVGILNITAPNAEYVRFDNGRIVDWTLVNSCRSRIKTLQLELRGLRDQEHLGQELFDMPRLEELHSDFCWKNLWMYYESSRWYFLPVSGSKSMVSLAPYSISAFWRAVTNNDLTTLRSSLPSLKHLTLIHDPLLSEEIFLKYVKIREVLGFQGLTRVTLLLSNHQSKNIDGLDALRVSMPGLRYKRYEDWETERNTNEWKDSTIFDCSHGSVDWVKLEQGRDTVKSLFIKVNKLETKERLKSELFNMPELENLELNFSPLRFKKRNGTLFGLWGAIMTGSTADENVALKDILPRLRKLKIINDITLDEDMIVKMIAVRKDLDLSDLEEMTVYLAKRCSSEVAKLDLLKISMSGFTYKCFEEWKKTD